MRFEKGQKLIVSGHGLGTVKRLDTKTIGNVSKVYYIIEIDNSQLTVMLPVDASNVRPICSESEALTVIASVNRMTPKLDTSTWNRRYREFMELLKTGELIDTLTVFKSLASLKKQKDLSFGERKMLDAAKEIAETELRESIGVIKTTQVLETLAS